jgi:hypothetical protein
MPEWSGAALARSIREGLPPGVELDEREEALLAAAKQADAVEALQADIAERGYLVPNPKGGLSLNPSVPETRMGRAAFARLLGGLDLPESKSLTRMRASKAATARWQERAS